MIASTLIDMARSRLGDSVKHRWTEKRMLTILDQGQKDFCKLSGIYRKSTVIPLSVDTNIYTLPTDAISINRVEYEGELIPLFSRNDIDAERVITTGFVGIKDNLSMTQLELYPTSPDLDLASDIRVGVQSADTFELDTLFGVVTYIEQPFEVVDAYGEVADAEYDMSLLEINSGFGEVCDTSDIAIVNDEIPPYGVAVAIDYADSDIQHGFVTSSDLYEVIGKYGITSSIVDENGYIRIYYIAIPRTVSTTVQALDIHDMWESAMLRYLVGTALQDDNDSSNVQRGELELQKYTQEVLKAREITTKDFSRGQPDKLKTRYRRT